MAASLGFRGGGRGALGKAFIGRGHPREARGLGSNGGSGSRVMRAEVGDGPDVWGPPVSGSARLASGARMAVTQGAGGVGALLLVGWGTAGPRPKRKARAGSPSGPGGRWAAAESWAREERMFFFVKHKF